jgi:hypothetical protein
VKKLPVTVGLTASLALLGQASAHHSYAMFDLTQSVAKAATVKEVQWTAPHQWIHFMIPDGKGGANDWAMEVAILGRPDNGWGRKALAVGDKVTVHFHPLRSGAYGGQMFAVQLSGTGKLFGNLTQEGIGIGDIKKAEAELKGAAGN